MDVLKRKKKNGGKNYLGEVEKRMQSQSREAESNIKLFEKP